MSQDSEELIRFRTAWRQELKHSRKESQRSDTHQTDEQDVEREAITIFELHQEMQDNTKISGEKLTVLNQPKDIILINLPDPASRQSTHINNAVKKQKLDFSDDDGENLLEQLISDIDEITVIPFFDIQLPREIGLKVFQFLDLRDLCHCAQVSKAWKNLAEDDILWFNFSTRFGFAAKKSSVSEETNWKSFTHKRISEQRQLQSRWKERVCKVDSMDYERGGILCAVSVSNDHVCAGYLSGAVLLWDIKELTYKQLNHELTTQSNIYPTCSAINSTICAAGYNNGSICVWHPSLTTSSIHHYQLEGPVKSIVLSTSSHPVAVSISDNEMRIDVTDDNGRWFNLKNKNFQSKIQEIKMLSKSTNVSPSVVIATRDTLYMHGTCPGDDITTVDHVVGGKMSCVDCDTDLIAVGVGPYGYGILGNTVRIYRPDSGRLTSVLSGHYYEITCLNVQDSPRDHLITGSYDRRVRIYDMRNESIVLNLRGHEDYVTSVQMDDWKVVSGAHNGEVCVWDQRTSAVLWRTHARHPVRLCHFNGVHLVTASIPIDISPQPNIWYADDLILHRRNRGSLRLFDFSSDNSTQGLPGICSSGYDDTSGYNYNIALVTPYDDINE